MMLWALAKLSHVNAQPKVGVPQAGAQESQPSATASNLVTLGLLKWAIDLWKW
jgi:hypothetical protein